jgi:ribosome-binding protein aMBF1 (putative translation factor)
VRSGILCHPALVAPLLTAVIVNGNIWRMIVQATNTFRENLRAAMQTRGISQRELAEKAGTGYPNLNRVLSGKQNVTLELADRLADALNLTLSELLGKKSRRKAG